MNITLGKLVDYEGCANELTGFGFGSNTWDIIVHNEVINLLRTHADKETILDQTYNYDNEETIEEVQSVLMDYNIINEEDVF